MVSNKVIAASIIFFFILIVFVPLIPFNDPVIQLKSQQQIDDADASKYPGTTPDYKEMINWVGNLDGGKYAYWVINIQKENNIQNVIRGQIKELTGKGVNLYVFDETKFTYFKTWMNIDPDFGMPNVVNSGYSFNLPNTNNLYIVVDNRKSVDGKVVSLTLDWSFRRPLIEGETQPVSYKVIDREPVYLIKTISVSEYIQKSLNGFRGDMLTYPYII